jgi:RimJ/RimL family protein N-acetyltransferase
MISPLQSQRLLLRTIEDRDIPSLTPLFQDLDVMQFYLPTLLRPYSAAQLQEMLKEWHDESTYFLFSIVEKASGKVVGLINLDGVNWSNRYTEIGIAIASPADRGKGFAGEALRLLIDYCFKEMGLHRVFARIIEGNRPSVHLFNKLGFTQEGTLREQVFRHGGWRDMYVYGILAAEWDHLQADC